MDGKTEEKIQSILGTLTRLTGLHRQLLETIRLEREALISADLHRIEEATGAKQALVEAVRRTEAERLRFVAELSLEWKKPARELTLPKLIVATQGEWPKLTEQLRSAYNALTILIKRITDQNEENRLFVESSLMHVQEMKNNVLGETVPKSNTYTAKGQKSGGRSGARLIEKEI